MDQARLDKIRADRARQLSLGITRAVWRYSSAPCMVDPKSGLDAAQDRVHKASHGIEFDLKEGCWMGDRFTWPGEEPGCMCGSTPVIAGFD